jgi:hypothetical protein
MKGLLLFATAAIMFCTSAAASKAKFADNVLGAWCVDEQHTNEYYTFYQRRDECRETSMLIGPDRIRRPAQDCRVMKITAGPTRRGDALYSISLRCEHPYGVRTERWDLWDTGDGLMLRDAESKR